MCKHPWLSHFLLCKYSSMQICYCLTIIQTVINSRDLNSLKKQNMILQESHLICIGALTSISTVYIFWFRKAATNELLSSFQHIILGGGEYLRVNNRFQHSWSFWKPRLFFHCGLHNIESLFVNNTRKHIPTKFSQR